MNKEELAIQRVRDLHKPDEFGHCVECFTYCCWGCGEWGSDPLCECQRYYPCDTVKALDGEQA